MTLIWNQYQRKKNINAKMSTTIMTCTTADYHMHHSWLSHASQLIVTCNTADYYMQNGWSHMHHNWKPHACWDTPPPPPPPPRLPVVNQRAPVLLTFVIIWISVQTATTSSAVTQWEGPMEDRHTWKTLMRRREMHIKHTHTHTHTHYTINNMCKETNTTSSKKNGSDRLLKLLHNCEDLFLFGSDCVISDGKEIYNSGSGLVWVLRVEDKQAGSAFS